MVSPGLIPLLFRRWLLPPRNFNLVNTTKRLVAPAILLAAGTPFFLLKCASFNSNIEFEKRRKKTYANHQDKEKETRTSGIPQSIGLRFEWIKIKMLGGGSPCDRDLKAPFSF